MKKIAIDKARKRLSMAAVNLASLKRAKNFEEFEPVWYHFLVSANAVDMILYENSKGSREKPWYGRKVNIRRTDPLLSYMHAARNADEHGVEPVVQHQDGFLAFGIAGEAVHIGSIRTGPDGSLEAIIHPVNGKYPTVVNQPPYPKLVTVVDNRFGDRFDPPTEHLGKPLIDRTPVAVATIWLAYLEGLVSEAEQFVE